MATRALIVVAALVAVPQPARAEPAMVTFGDDGVRVGDELVVTGKVTSAAIDVYRERLYYVQKKTLYALPLDVDDAKAVAIARPMPPGAWMMDAAGFHTSETAVYPMIDELGKVVAAEGPWAGMVKAADKRARAAIKKIKVVGKKWLKKHRTELLGKGIFVAPSVGAWNEIHTPLHGDEACDYNPSIRCGQAERVPWYDGVWIEVVANACDAGGCHEQCLLHAGDTWATPDVAGAWTEEAPTTTGPCFDYVWHDGTYAVGQARCSLNKDGVSCEADPGWIAAGLVSWPPGVQPTQAEHDGIEGEPLTTIDRADPTKGLPAIATDTTAVILPVRGHDDVGAVTLFDWCTAGTVECERTTMGHDDDSRVLFEIRTEGKLKQTVYVPMPYWRIDEGAKQVKTDFGIIAIARTKKSLTVTVSTWDDVELGHDTYAVPASTELVGVGLAQGAHPTLYVRLAVDGDEEWKVFPLTVPPE